LSSLLSNSSFEQKGWQQDQSVIVESLFLPTWQALRLKTWWCRSLASEVSSSDVSRKVTYNLFNPIHWGQLWPADRHAKWTQVLPGHIYKTAPTSVEHVGVKLHKSMSNVSPWL